MGKYRTELLFPAEDLGASGTKTIPIETLSKISRLELTYKTTKGSEGMSYGAPANITKIELIDGGTPIHYVTGYTAQALGYYNRKGVSFEHGQHIGSSSEMDTYPIDFGRFLHDPLLAFDPTKFKEPALRVSFNEALADTSASAGTLEVWAELFDEYDPSPMGFLRAQQNWSGNFLSNNSINNVDLFSDEVIRQILVRANQAGYEPWYQIDIAVLKEISTGKIVFDFEDLEVYYRRMKSRWPMIITPLIINIRTSTGRYFYIPQTDYWAGVNLIAEQTLGYMYSGLVSMKGGKIDLVGSVDMQAFGQAFGYLPWHTFQFPLGGQDDPNDWYDPTSKKPRLALTSAAGGTSGDGEVIIETVKRY